MRANAQDLQVDYVDGGIGLLCVMVRENTDVGERPAKNVGNDEDGSILRVACDIGLIFA